MAFSCFSYPKLWRNGVTSPCCQSLFKIPFCFQSPKESIQLRQLSPEPGRVKDEAGLDRSSCHQEAGKARHTYALIPFIPSLTLLCLLMSVHVRITDFVMGCQLLWSLDPWEGDIIGTRQGVKTSACSAKLGGQSPGLGGCF